MSLTSYRAAPSRVTVVSQEGDRFAAKPHRRYGDAISPLNSAHDLSRRKQGKEDDQHGSEERRFMCADLAATYSPTP